jgi:hypothetical protein
LKIEVLIKEVFINGAVAQVVTCLPVGRERWIHIRQGADGGFNNDKTGNRSVDKRSFYKWRGSSGG